MDRSVLQRTLLEYKSDFEEEMSFVPRFFDLLRYANAYERSLLHGHITASAWVVNPAHTKVLLLHHAKLNRWLQPGGHADGNEDLPRIAVKELVEETGISGHLANNGLIFDLDIHAIPAHKNVPAHEHYDVRFLIVADENATIQQNHESKDIRWFALNAVPGDASMLRMAMKTKALT